MIKSIKYVDATIAQECMDKFKMWEKLKFDILFVGDDWFETPKWKEIEEQFKDVNVKVVYFPYTKSTSSTMLNNALNSLRQK